MKAMILAAGLGTRLRPLTDSTPKALVTIKNRTLLEIIINRLKTFGINEMIINVHHFADHIIQYIKNNHFFNIRIEISKEDNLLDTGGSLKKASWFFNKNETILVHNVDIITDLDLDKMRQYHLTNGSFATLAVRKRQTQRYFVFDENEQSFLGMV